MRSFANRSAAGGTIESPGGGRFLVLGGGAFPELSESDLEISAASPLADFKSRCSMMFRCCSRTDKLLCSCSRIVGSSVWIPGERQANPTSCMAVRESRAVKGVAEGLELLE